MIAESTPLVSVCIPVYNGGPFIGQAIQSVLDQTLTDYEIVVLDNASEDDTASVVGAFRDPRLRVIHHDSNIGAAANWNRALEEARAPYVKLLCADDRIAPDCLRRQVDAMESNPTVVLATSRRRIIDEHGRPGMVRGFRRTGLVSGLAARRLIVRSGTNPVGEPSAVLLRRTCADAAGRFDERSPYVIDVEYWMRVLRHGDLWAIREPLADYRVSSTSWSVEVADRQVADYRRMLSEVEAQDGHALEPVDLALGRVMAGLNARARRLFYTIRGHVSST